MNKIILASLLTCTSIIGYTEPQMMRVSVPCGSANEVMEAISKYDENPMLTMITHDNLRVSMLVNPKTKTYTFVVEVRDDLYCILNHGTGVRPHTQ